MNKKIIILLFALLQVVSAKTEFITNVHAISRRDGLSNGAVNSIVKDAEGYVWMGTWNGLNRYDGSNIATYLPGSSSHSIHNHVIREMYPVASGPIWMLTNQGVGLYDNVGDRFFSFFTNESDQINYENDIAICHSDRVGTFVTVNGRGVFRFDTASHQFARIGFSGRSASVSHSIKRIHIIGSSLYCISDSGTLFKKTGDQLTEILQISLTGTITTSMAYSNGNNAYIFIAQRNGVAMKLDLQAKKVYSLSVKDDIITSFAASGKKGNIWTGTEKGNIFRINLSKPEFEPLHLSTGDFKTNSIGTRILSLYESKADILWIGTDGNGAYNLKLTEFPNQRLASEKLSYPIVRSILVTRKNDILVGTKGGGIDVFDADGKHKRQISVQNGLSNNSVISLLEQRDGSIWAGVDGKGIDIISSDYNTIRNFPKDFIIPDKLDFASVYRILKSSDGRIYLGTSGYGVILVELDKQTGSIPISCEQVVLDTDMDSPAKQQQIVYTLAEEKPGVIWIGTRGWGVFRYNTITKRVIGHYSNKLHPKLIGNDDVISLFADRNGYIWVGTSNGLFSLIPVSADSVSASGLSLQSDLSSASIHSIQDDRYGNLWLTTNQGLSLIDQGRENVRSFNTNDGLINYEYSDGASFFDPNDSLLYVGGTMGVDIIRPHKIKFSSYFPPLAINRLLISNVPMDVSDNEILTSRINLQKDLHLKYNENTLTFRVSPLVYWGKDRHKIWYRLKNFDDTWTTNLQQQAISFSNLDPGNYIFQLRVTDENGKWSDEIREIKIFIRPPFWRTGWAFIVYFLIIIGIQVLIIRTHRQREARKKELALQEFKKKREDELQQYKLEFFTNVAHEFRTPLTLISTHVDELIEDSPGIRENSRLQKVYRNSIKLQKLVLEIMQFRKLEKGKEPLNIQLTKPVELINEIITDFELLTRQRNISCELITEQPDIEFKTDADKFQRIITNLISNAIKYNKPGGFIKIRVHYINSVLHVEIEDNGEGINQAFLQKIFEPFGIPSVRKKDNLSVFRSTGLGLAVTKGLVELLKGNIRVESEPERGTTFFCYLPDVHQLSSEVLIDDPASGNTERGYIEDVAEPLPVKGTTKVNEKHTILIIDDEPEMQKLLRNILRQDFNVLIAGSGLEGYDKLIEANPDLIVSDVIMPGMDGIDLCKKIRDNVDTSHLPLILLTAKAEIEDRISGLRAGADAYIPKPFHSGHLKAMILNLLELRQRIRDHVGRHTNDPALVKEIPDPFFQKLLSYIDENLYDEHLSSEKICDKLAVSKSSLYNKTKSVLGITPHSLINQRRLSKAATLLRSTLLTVSEIIDQTGFASRTHFYDLFNKAYACSPSEYRKGS